MKSVVAFREWSDNVLSHLYQNPREEVGSDPLAYAALVVRALLNGMQETVDTQNVIDETFKDFFKDDV